MRLERGMRVYWLDPDEDQCSGFGVVIEVDEAGETTEDTIVSIRKDDGGEVDAMLCEVLVPVSPSRCEHGMFFTGAGACPQCGG